MIKEHFEMTIKTYLLILFELNKAENKLYRLLLIHYMYLNI